MHNLFFAYEFEQNISVILMILLNNTNILRVVQNYEIPATYPCFVDVTNESRDLRVNSQKQST